MAALALIFSPSPPTSLLQKKKFQKRGDVFLGVPSKLHPAVLPVLDLGVESAFPKLDEL